MAAKPESLSESSSFLLDAIRLAAALLVVVAHLSRPDISVVLTRNLQFLGDLAVPIFFVLSGFVIRFVTVSREHTLRVYLIDRASRIYSVALPAMALTVATAAVIFRVDPAYAREALAPLMNHPALRVLANLTFLSQLWGRNSVLFANSPFWSLSYECLFYLAYGLLFYLRGVRRVAAVLVWAAIAGPQILFLFPLWLLGCGLHDVYQFVRRKPIAAILRKLTLLFGVIALAQAALGRTGWLLAPIRLDQAIAALPNPLAVIHQASLRATMQAIANGTLAAAAMFLLLLLSDWVPLARSHPFARSFRRLADGTFTIYLMHYPLMMLARALNLLRPNDPILNTITVTCIVLLLIAVASPLDAFKSILRKTLGPTCAETRGLARPAPRAAALDPLQSPPLSRTEPRALPLR
jgi:peptidoglycan/LPS O-acetylase OafA/YrhL